MGGRGRGARGRGLSFNVEQLGFGRGEALPTPVLQPPALFPTLQYKPVPLLSSEEQDYLLSLKQEFRGRMRESAFFIHPPERKRDIERYSDKYHDSQSKTSVYDKVDWARLPSELKPTVKKKRKVAVKPTAKVKKKVTSNVDVEQKLKDLEKDENDVKEDEEEEGKPKPAEDEDDQEVIDDEFYDEEEQEEGTDYISSYFDNGEGYLEESEDNLDDGPTY